MTATVEKLPFYLKAYCVNQPAEKYTPRDHAAWRYIMRQSRDFFREHAVPVYLEGLKATGITVNRIPSIDEMDVKLQRIGWGAVPVCGFIPPAAFLDFQARRILPIASDMRTLEHIDYTPAPDIVHEAAGHAPILADPLYAEYLTMYAAMAQKAIFSREDLDLYEAIRTLSDVKENPDSNQAQISAAEAALARASAAQSQISEANKVARMNWWTVEYGLLGSLANPRIYGAGLLSSVGESQVCLTPKVKKLPLTLACVETSYDITEPQPQLFVAENLSHLVQVLKEFEATLAFHRGGTYGLTEAQKGRTVTTARLDSGLEVSGILSQFGLEKGLVAFLRYTGPVQLAAQGSELQGQGVAQHAEGFSSPLGRFARASQRPATRLTDQDLAALGLIPGQKARLELTTGYVVEGELVRSTRAKGKLILLTWRNCRVTKGSELFFDPTWGVFDMAVGEEVEAVYGGPADREKYGAHDMGRASTTPGRVSPFSADERAAFSAYAEARRLREALTAPEGTVRDDEILRLMATAARFPSEWLLRVEALELAYLAKKQGIDDTFGLDQGAQDLGSALAAEATRAGEPTAWLLRQGLALANTMD